MSFQTVITTGDLDTQPANVSITHSTLWITDRHVAAFYEDLPQSTVERLQELRRAADEPGEPPVELTRTDRAEIKEAAENVSRTSSTTLNYSVGNASPTRHGIGTYSVTPPEDARIGFTVALGNASAANASYAYGTESVVFVDGQLREFARKHTQPDEEDRYDLIVEGFWDSHREGDWVVPNDTIEVDVALYDSMNDTLVDGATVRLYSTTDNVTTVTTDGTEFVTVEVPVPDVDWRTASSDQREQDVVGIAEGFQDADGRVLADRETYFGSVYRDDDASDDREGVRASPELAYDNDTLRATLNYYNVTSKQPANATRTLMFVTTPAIFNTPERDVNVSFVDPPSDQHSVTYNFSEPVPSTERREYFLGTRTGDTRPFETYLDTVHVGGLRAIVDAPDQLSAGQSSTVTVTLVDRNGDPVTDASVVWEYFEGSVSVGDGEGTSLSLSHGAVFQLSGDTETGITDQNGQVTFNVTAPALDSEHDVALDLAFRVGAATDEVSYPYTGIGGIDVIEEPPVNVTGRVLKNDSTAAAGNLIQARTGPRQFAAVNRTDSEGRFSFEITNNTQFDLTFVQEDVQSDGTVVLPRDDTVDAWPIDQVQATGDQDLGEITLPEGHVVNVTVVDESGEPVENARIRFHIRNDATGADLQSRWFQTLPDGMFYTGPSQPGVELRDNVTVSVKPPEDSNRFPEQLEVRHLDVTGTRNVTITLEERFTSVSGRLFENDSAPAVNDSIAIFVEPPSDEAGILNVGHTNATGHFTQSILEDEPNDVAYYQAHPNFFPAGSGQPPANETAFARDGSGDMFALARVNSSSPVDLGNMTLPEGHVVNVTVVDENGSPVEDAHVSLTHWGPGGPPSFNGTNPEAGLVFVNGTNSDGMFEPNVSDRPGLELTGNVTVRVKPPADDPRFEERTYVTDLTVTNDTNRTITLEERQTVPTVAIESGETAPGASTSVNLTLSEAPAGLAGYAINLTIEDGSVANFTGASVPGSFGQSDVEVTQNGDRITITGLDQSNNTVAGDTDVLLASVTVEGSARGETDISVDVVQMDDDNGSAIRPFTQSARLNVSSLEQICTQAGCGVPTDPDGDGQFEDMDGNGRLGFNDVVVYFEHIFDDSVQDHAAAYDFNGNGRVDFDDIVKLFEEV
jgi:protocatechuate 3,4-dioxygenase beta subunit